MARSTGPVVLAGGLAAANEALFAPMADGKPPAWGSVWRLVPVTAGLAVALDLLERAAPQFAVGLAWLLVAAVFVFPPGNAGPLIGNINKVFKL